MPAVGQQGGKQRWLGYTCPDCRMIFRIEAGSQGQRAQCPGCHALMILGGGSGALAKVPAADAPPTELYQEAVIETPEEETLTYLDEGGSMRRRVAILGPAEADQDDLVWERSHAQSEIGTMALTVMLVVVLAFVGGIGYLVYGIVREDFRAERTVPSGMGEVEVAVVENELAKETGPDGPIIDLELSREVGQIKKAVRMFLDAATVEDLLGVVRHRERLEESIRSYYVRRGYRPGAVLAIAPQGKVQMVKSLFSVLVELDDYSMRPIAVEKIDGSYLVDWESWVGYSEMEWEEFLKTRPTVPKLFRVRCSPVEYYNFDFIDDSKWQSFRLESPDEEFLIFGYAERFSDVTKELTPRDDSRKDAAVTVALRFPAEARTRNQVVISKFLGSGWVQVEEQE